VVKHLAFSPIGQNRPVTATQMSDRLLDLDSANFREFPWSALTWPYPSLEKRLDRSNDRNPACLIAGHVVLTQEKLTQSKVALTTTCVTSLIPDSIDVAFCSQCQRAYRVSNYLSHLHLEIGESLPTRTLAPTVSVPIPTWQSDCNNTGESVGHARRVLTRLLVTNREAVMWMRSCALCKAILRKFHLSETVRCQCGWQW